MDELWEDIELEETAREMMEQMEEEEIESARAGHSNGAKLRRQHQFHVAAQYVAIALCSLPAVQRIVLFGSVALPLKQEEPYHKSDRRAHLPWVWHECVDIDLAIWVNDLSILRSLQRARSKALQFLLAAHEIGVAHHQVEVFIMEPETDRYLGRLCTFSTCPKGKRDCETPGCGITPLLKILKDFDFRPEALHPAYSICLYDAETFPGLRDSALLQVMKE